MVAKHCLKYVVLKYLKLEHVISLSYIFVVKNEVLYTTKQVLRYFNAIGTIEAMYSNGWIVRCGEVVEIDSDIPYRYILRFSDE